MIFGKKCCPINFNFIIIFVQAEFGWDDSNHINRGLGDYRIPKGLLTNVDGSRIQVSEIVDHRGWPLFAD